MWPGTGSSLASIVEGKPGSDQEVNNTQDPKVRTEPALFLEAPTWVHWPLVVLW